LKRILFLIFFISAIYLLPAQKGKDFHITWYKTKSGLFSQPIDIAPGKNDPFLNLQIFLKYKGNSKPQVYLITAKDTLKVEEDHLQPEPGKWFGFIDLPNRKQTVKLLIRHAKDFRLRAHKIRIYYPGKSMPVNPKKTQNKHSAEWCNCPYPPAIPREQWCPDNHCPPPSSYVSTDVRFLIVHHTATPNNESDWPARVRQIWDFHVHTRGWADIGYNYLIDQNGYLYVGRGEDVKGAHFSGYNSGTCGIAYLGTFTQFTPPDTMHATFEKYAAYKSCQKQLIPGEISRHAASERDLYTISGHRDSGSGTECPGDVLYGQLPALREATQETMCGCNRELNLVAQRLHADKDQIKEGEKIRFHATMRNLSGVDSSNDSIYFTINGTPVIRDFLSAWPACGEEKRSGVYTFTEAGTHSLCVEIIHSGAETHTEDNKICRTVYVMPDRPDHYVIYPNPANQYFGLKIPNGRSLRQVALFDMAGRNVKNFSPPYCEMDVSKLAGGVYHLVIEDNREETFSSKLLITH